jgi:hypothetical protein
MFQIVIVFSQHFTDKCTLQNGLQNQDTRWRIEVTLKERECRKNTRLSGFSNTEH